MPMPVTRPASSVSISRIIALPQSGATLTKETAEKEQAVKDAHAAEAAAVSAVNKVFALASHHRAAHPKLHQALSSATRKHYAKLHP